MSNPTEEKFRKIRISNKAYQERIHPIEGTKEFLEAAGFTIQELPFNDATDKFWVMSFCFIVYMSVCVDVCMVLCFIAFFYRFDFTDFHLQPGVPRRKH